MATVQELERQLAQQQADLTRLKREFDAASTRAATAFEDYQNALRALEGASEYRAGNVVYPTKAAFVAARKAAYDAAAAERKRLSDAYDNAQRGINATRTALNQAKAASDDAAAAQRNNQSRPASASAGTQASNAARARDDGATVQTPQTTPGRVTQASNAQPFRANATTGTNAPTRTTANTQSTPPPTAATPIGGNRSPQAANRSGQGAATDDGAPPANAAQRVARSFDRLIVPQDNVLDAYASYTYNIGIYIMSPENIRQFYAGRRNMLNSQNLLIQSGGAPAGERNQFFPLDFYIDDVELKMVMPTEGTGMPFNVTGGKMKIIEPLGVTLLQRLFEATKAYVAGEGAESASTRNQNYASQTYLMVIKFYGYDPQGNLVQNASSSRGTATTDPNAIVEKFIPFMLTNIRFQISNKLTEYDCEFVMAPNVTNTGQQRGVVPYNVQLQAPTVKSILSKLESSLNTFAQDQVAQGIFTVADKYRIIIAPNAGDAIGNAKITPPGPPDKATTGNIQPADGAQAKDGDKQSVDFTQKITSATAGQSIIQFIDQVVRNSEYITSQQKSIKGTDRDGKPINTPQGGAAESMVWYRIGMSSKPIGDKIDPKRNDYAYEMTYEIAPYGISLMKSPYFPNGRFRGVQKRYNYWFTGQNTQVLKYDADFNYLYYIVVNSAQGIPDASLANYHEVEKRGYQASQPESSQGAAGDVFDPAASAASFLYSPGDAHAQIQLIGDPAWIYQGELLGPVRSQAPPGYYGDDAYLDAFLPDGTINFDSQEALFEISFSLPDDYNLQTGLMNVVARKEPQ
jgi:hypothetical protein